MKSFQCFFVTVLTAVALSASVQAATFVVNDTGDGVDEDTGDGICEVTDSTGDCTLRAALDQANSDNAADTITFDATTFPAGGGTIISTTSELLLEAPVTISGPGVDTVTVDNDASSRVFHIDHNGFTAPAGPHSISGLRIEGGDGGILIDHVEADVTLNALIIAENNGTGDGGGILIESSLVSGSVVTISNCVIANNEGDSGGGVAVDSIGSSSSVSIQASLIIDNAALGGSQDGGGVANIGGNAVSITNTLILNNSANDDGGGVYSDTGGTLTITDSSIIDNDAGDDGGGVKIISFDELETTSATFTRTRISGNTNVGGNDGGGIMMDGDPTDIATSTLAITDSTITDNFSDDDGGGIFVTQATATITGSTIDSNSAGAGTTDEGGGIVNEGGADLTIDSSTISHNLSGGAGGGIRNEGSASSITITNSTISGNISEDNGGGGISNDNDTDNS